MPNFIDWAFRDRSTGEIVIGQWPNTPLWTFIAASSAEWVLGAVAPGLPPWLFLVLRIVALVGLAVWAADEVARGVNPWRRFLGALGLLGLAISLADLL
ncbi:hypothetical protein [Methylorubrum sp. SB2]|uniref:hypothetical protein n=1 Tax=Methylorubrum subtropicum TaxID=3138812 RepID=UPI00313C4918